MFVLFFVTSNRGARINRIWLFLGLFLLTGSGATGSSLFEARMARLVGISEPDLLSRMGPPAYDHTHQGKRSLGYSETWIEGGYVPNSGGQLARLIHSRTACCKKVRTLNGFDVWGHGIFCHGSFLPKPLENREIMWISEDAVNKTG